MSKLDRINRVQNELTEDDLYQDLPELLQIGDQEIGEETTRTFLDWCPEYFWEKPSSSSGKYHPPDERGDSGNWLHTKRVFLSYNQLARSWTEQHKITAHEYHCGQSAALLHDMLKYGWPSEQNNHTVDNHDVLVAEVVRKKTDLPDEVADACEAHNGAWGEGKNPETNLEQLVHLADMTAAPKHFTVPVPGPTETLKEETGVSELDDL